MLSYEYYWKIDHDFIYIRFYDKKLPRPPRVIGKIRKATIHKKYIYYHCRSMLR